MCGVLIHSSSPFIQDGGTALHAAAGIGHTSTARLLVARCPQLLKRVNNVSVCVCFRTILCLTRMCSQIGETALNCARDEGKFDTAAFLEVRPRYATTRRCLLIVHYYTTRRSASMQCFMNTGDHAGIPSSCQSTAS